MARMAADRVLVTGMSGLVGAAVRRRLEGRYRLRALNRRAVAGVETVRADIADLAAIRPAFAGVDVVVHLAANTEAAAPWPAVLDQNVVGTYNVFEAAREAGARRVVYASSGATVSGWERDPPYRGLVEGRYGEIGPAGWPLITHEAPNRPNGLYGASKVWGEALARHYSDAHGMSMLCLRIGVVNDADRPTEPRHFSVWCSQRDIASMVLLCVEAPEALRFDVFFVTSDNRWGYRDLDHARAVLGFRPEDRAEDWR
jgi:nucleoside-diphosphate-sugar epimerase